MESKALYKNLSDKIRSLRKEKGLTQAELSELAGISAYYMGEVERLKKRPSIYTMLQIANAFGMKLSEFLRELEL